jgi:transcriptional regulator with XRE-family HTH domain
MADLYDRMREERLMDPALVRIAIEQTIGEDRPYPTAAALAHDIGVHPEQLYQFLRGKRQHLEPKLASAFNLEKVTFYRPLNKIACNPEKSSA